MVPRELFGFTYVMAWLACLLLCGATVAEPVEWSVCDGGNGHWYDYVPAFEIPWDTAQAVAEANGGYLATLTSAAENDIVTEVMDIPGTDGAWLGGYQPNPGDLPADGWEWVTGEAWSYTNWDPDEPNDFGGSEWLLEVWGSQGDGPVGSWNDADDTAGHIRGYVIEYDSVPGHTYEFVQAVGIARDDAEAAAEAMGGHLATITSAAESDIVTGLIDIPGVDAVWLGGYQPDPGAPVADGWEWVTAEAWCFTHWDSDEPNDWGGSEWLLGVWGPSGDGPVGRWNDADDTTGHIDGYVVEFPVNVACGGGYWPYGDVADLGGSGCPPGAPYTGRSGCGVLVGLPDIVYVLNAFARGDDWAECYPNADIRSALADPCQLDGSIALPDVVAVLEAFGGDPLCVSECPCW